MSRVRVTIDRLVLKGFAPEQPPPLAEAFQAELSRALADRTERATWARAQHIPLMRLSPMALAPGRSGGRKLGTAIARAIAEGPKR